MVEGKRQEITCRLVRLTKLCTTRHCGSAHAAASEGSAREPTAPKSHLFLLRPIYGLPVLDPRLSLRRAGPQGDAFIGLRSSQYPAGHGRHTLTCEKCVGNPSQAKSAFIRFCNCTVPRWPRDSAHLRSREKKLYPVPSSLFYTTPTAPLLAPFIAASPKNPPRQQCRWQQKTLSPSSMVCLCFSALLDPWSNFFFRFRR